MHKEQRWYDVQNGLLHVYGDPHGRGEFVSITQLADLPYYRANFHLRKVWSKQNAYHEHPANP